MSDFCPNCGNHMLDIVCELCSDNFNYEVAEELRKKVEAIEQQLKTAKADGVREFANKYCGECKRDEQIWLSTAALLYCEELEEYANNLEGK